MKTTQESLNLKELEVFLTKRLAQEYLDITSLIVNCIKEKDEITILLQHSPPVSSFSEQIFSLVKKLLKQKSFGKNQQFKLCLAIYGESPYVVDNFTVLSRHKTKQKTFKKGKKINSKNTFLFLLFGGSLFTLTFIYLSIQPCVIGKCENISNAQELARESQELIKEEDLLKAELKLKASLENLQSIPWFSSSYSEAKKLSNDYEKKLNNLQEFLEDINIANQTLIEFQKLKTTAEWEQYLQKLAQVINNLRKVSNTSEFYTISQETLTIYEQKLTELTNLYNLEKSAENNVLTAVEMAQISVLRQQQAYSLKEWQLVNLTWSLVTNRLKAITPENIAYQQTQQLLTEYQPIIKEAQDKLKQEETAYKTSQYAINTAQKARKSEQEQQYTLAIEHWKNALNILSKINPNTSQFEQSQTLSNDYQTFLTQAEQQLKFSQIRQKANQDLEKICLNQEKICTYTLGKDNLIKVYLNQEYLQKVLRIAISNQIQGDLMQHISSVQKALEVVSNKHQLSLEVYHSDGGLLFSYSPN